MSNKSGGKGPMRQWAEASYSPTTGCAARSSLSARESYSNGGVTKPWSVSRQIPTGVEAMNKSGSGDPGRIKFNREGSGETPPGGRSDDQAPRSR